jgi:hypothetical protein
VIAILKKMVVICFSLGVSYIFARSVIVGRRTKKINLKTVCYDREVRPRMFAFAMGFNTLVSATWLLGAVYFIFGGSLL